MLKPKPKGTAFPVLSETPPIVDWITVGGPSGPPAPVTTTRRHRVSILVISHREEFAPEAMASAFAQGPEHQVIYWHSRQNWPSKINEAVRASDGEFFAIVPEDDLLAPGFTARCLEHAGEADAVFTDRLVFNDGDDPTAGRRSRHFGDAYQDAPYYVLAPPASYFEFGVTWPATFLCRRSFWDQLGGLDETMPRADTEWWARCAFAGGRIQYIPAGLLFYRRHARQYGVQHPEGRPFLTAFHRKHFARFGLDFDRAREIAPNQLYVEPIPEAARDAYLAAHPEWRMAS